MTRVLSCIQPTGDVHLGNSLGALRNWVSGQHECDAFHGIVDLHALTVTDVPGVVGDSTMKMAAMLYAVGLDPDVATVFVQSHVPEHAQLAWIMECTVSFGELSRMVQFKDKSAKREGEFISAGLFTYPALQAADILLYDAEEVPVGDDQRQHVEITRDIAIRFNSRFGETFVVPKAVTPKAGARVMDLQDPTSKMSKSSDSETGLVYLLETPAEIMKKFKRAVTDSDNEVRFDREAKPGVSNLLDIMSTCTGEDPQAIAQRYTQYGPLKTDAGHAVIELLRPIQARYHELLDDPGELASMIETNAREAGIALDTDMLEIPVSTVARRVAVDGRMMLHEWVDTGSGVRKVDALDHHDDDFFPGCRDIAWDVAGMCVEADLDPRAAEYFVGKYRDITGDSDIGRRLPFYEAAYSAFRLGYSRMASESVADTAEARRFRQMELMYADRLRRFQRSA